MGTLPYLALATLKAQGGEVLVEDIPISVWPTGGRNDSSSGQVYDHEAQADIDHAAIMGGGNRTLTVDEVDYKIVSGIPYPHLPHCQLLLRRVVPTGGF